jgi:UDP-N-acetylmuramoyl-tripeptide--D-alanyl-D-alanine ligase
MLDLATAAQAVGGRVAGGNVVFARVTTDSRDVRPGDLFVGIRGGHFDGQTFASQALAAGAVAAMVEDACAVPASGARLLVVPDARIALGRLASFWRANFAIPVVAVTGSSGKTTVKELLASILRQGAGDDAVHATSGNLNNDIGLPLTLLGLRAGHRFAVVEMGMNHPGEIAYLSKLARPTVALVNNAGTAHIGELGSIDAIAQAKGEIFTGLTDEGVAIINADDTFAGYWRTLNAGRRIVDFGIERSAAVSARFELAPTGSLVTFRTPDCEFVATLRVPGMHNVRNALAATTAAVVLGLDPGTISSGVAAYRGVKGRLQRSQLPSGTTLIDDTYNANPDSMKAAIAVLAAHGGPKIFVMGDMGELGAGAEAMHAEVGRFARAAGIDRLYAIGEASAAAARAFGEGGRHFAALDELVEAILTVLDRSATVLVKGSRFMRMERVVQALGAGNGAATAKGDL